MLRRHRAKRQIPSDPGPVVFDRHGQPVGVRLAAEPVDFETPQSARVTQRESLRKTRELEAQYHLLLPVSLFYRDPPH